MEVSGDSDSPQNFRIGVIYFPNHPLQFPLLALLSVHAFVISFENCLAIFENCLSIYFPRYYFHLNLFSFLEVLTSPKIGKMNTRIFIFFQIWNLCVRPRYYP